jgi:predicted O-methyltransferase YrrM
MKERVTQLGTIAGYGARKVGMALQGKESLLAQLHNRAWFESRHKKLPTVSLDELFPGTARLPIHLERSLPRSIGNLTTDELAAMTLICQWLKPAVVFEFGTFNGRTTLNLAANTPSDTKIYTLDLANPETTQHTMDQVDVDLHLRDGSGMFFRNTPVSEKIEQIWGDSALFDETALRGKVDLILVDAAHSYEYVRSDTTKALAMLRPGGVILWHDYCVWYPGVFQYLHELLAMYPLKHIEGTHFAVLR